MAQKREKEETELKVSKSIPLCTPNLLVSSQPLPHPSYTEDQKPASPSRTSVRMPEISDPNDLRSNSVDTLTHRSNLAEPEKKDSRPSVKRTREVSRCSGIGCRRQVGLIGIRCRCGEVFCSEHRYSDRHDCSYDYKAAGRETIARENPVVRAAKILKA